MGKWYGAAGVCMKDDKVLMVLQGTVDEPKSWSVPSGGKEAGETFEQCCIRETKEETGYDVQVIQPLIIKESEYGQAQYFQVELIGGQPKIQDPDDLIYEIAWKTADDLATLDLTYEEDREYLITMVKNK
jgi:ADP-ribose pyrophosphatase YjhB (NUDIX family)